MRYSFLLIVLLLCGCTAATSAPPRAASKPEASTSPQPARTQAIPVTATLPSPAPAALSGSHAEKALILEQQMNLRESAREYGLAAAEEPGQPRHLFKQGILLEASGDNVQAVKALEQAMKAAGPGGSMRTLIAHSTALLLASKLGQTDRIDTYRQILPPLGPEALDLEGFLLHSQGRSAQALPVLEKALGTAKDQNLQATIFYHMALCHQSLKDHESRGSSLFMAINLARERNLIADIETFWERINAEPPTDR